MISRMERCSKLLIGSPEEFKAFRGGASSGLPDLRLELGCGKGRFTVSVAEQNPDALFVAVERAPDALVVAMERAAEHKIENVRFISGNVADLPETFGDGEIGVIYINFCDPWQKNRHADRRLTAPRFLRMYARLLRPGGEIHFKTDNLPLFNYSLAQLKANNWELKNISFDLHRNGAADIMTDYELKFHAEGVKINRCVGVRTETTVL